MLRIVSRSAARVLSARSARTTQAPVLRTSSLWTRQFSSKKKDEAAVVAEEKTVEAVEAVETAPVAAEEVESKVAAETTEPPPPPPAPTPAPAQAPPGALRSKIAAFLAGVAVASVFGYARLQQDIADSHHLLSSSLAAASSDVAAASKTTAGKLKCLEARVQALEAATCTAVDNAAAAAPATATAE
jgi:hypothetical protein